MIRHLGIVVIALAIAAPFAVAQEFRAALSGTG